LKKSAAGTRNVRQPEEQADRGGEGVALEVPAICECCTGIFVCGGGAVLIADEKCKLRKTYAHRHGIACVSVNWEGVAFDCAIVTHFWVHK